MLARPTLTKRPDQGDANKPKGQARPTEERFLLRVDGQIKRSFSSKEAAATAGAVVKKAFPVVVVTVLDSKNGTTGSVCRDECFRKRSGASIAGIHERHAAAANGAPVQQSTK